MMISPETAACRADAADAADTGGSFAFRGPHGTLRADGPTRAVESGTGDSLPARIAHAFAGAGPSAVIGGALPFARHQTDCLWLAPACRHDLPVAASPSDRPSPQRWRADPAPRVYAGSVEQALRIMRAEATQPEGLRKIVLARTLAIEANGPIPQQALMDRLADDPVVTAFRVALPQPDRALIGATPELLVEKTGSKILSFPLAGSARRNPDPIKDADACAALARSEKDRREHAMVVEFILDTLAPWCSHLGAPEGTGLTSTRSMWHLGTRIEGRLSDPDTPSVLLAAALHPTPAVCGLPCSRAAALIGELEPVARDFYAGAVGWCRPDGDGAWFVAIRCADVCGAEARLYAGAGIVPGSDPDSETEETASKFAALLRAFGLPADAARYPTD